MTDKKIERPNTTQIPNSVIDAMSSMTDQELRVVLAVMRHTFGFGEPNHPLSVRYLADYTGMGQNSVMDGAAAAISDGYVLKVHQMNAKKYDQAVYAPAFRVPPIGRQGASHSEAIASQPEAGGASQWEAIASQPEAKTTLIKTTTRTRGPAADMFFELTGREPNPAQIADLSQINDHPHLQAVMAWAAREGLTSSRKIVAAARRWDPNPKKEQKHGSDNPKRRDQSNKPRPPAPQTNRPSPGRAEQDRKLAEERRRRQRELANRG